MAASPLDTAVYTAARALSERDVPPPALFLFPGTGVGTLPGELRSPRRVPLDAVPGVPDPWRGGVLHAGTLGRAEAWILEDAPGDLEFADGGSARAPWERGFPVWLAAAAGAAVCVHTSAGAGLAAPGEAPPPVGTLALVRDHLNLSGRTPLAELGATRLGPLFPDVSRLHHEGLRQHALERARAIGVGAREVVVACTLGPSQSTPAELAWYASAGAQVAVQGLADPLLACAHAGLALLAVAAVIDDGRPRRGTLRIAELVERAEACAPALDDLLTGLVPELGAVANALQESGT